MTRTLVIGSLILVAGCGKVVNATDASVNSIDARPSTDAAGPDAPCADSDGDGVCDVADKCPGHDDHVDGDGDGIPDGCDQCPANPDPNCTPHVCVIAFDSAYAALGQGGSADTYYAPYGVHFNVGGGYGVIGGQGNGDPGNWQINGTNGSAVWGLWQDAHSISFDSPVTSVSMDWMRAFTDFTISVTGTLAGNVVDTQTVSPTGTNGFATTVFAGPIDGLSWNIAQDYGMDNLVYTTTLSCAP